MAVIRWCVLAPCVLVLLGSVSCLRGLGSAVSAEAPTPSPEAPVPACTLSPLRRCGARLVDATGCPVRLFGTNVFHYHLEWSLSPDYESARRAFRDIARAGYNMVRLPLNMSHLQPARGVFPDDAQYAFAMRRHNLDPGWIAFLDWSVDYAGSQGLYVLLEFHELPTDPHRYFAGGQPAAKEKNEPGTAVAWMDRAAVENGASCALEAIADAHRWLAGHFRGHPAVAGIEVPFNEPHTEWWSSGENLRDAVVLCASAIKQADKSRLVFLACEAWGAGNANRACTWDVPEEVDVVAPHFYLALHAPVATRDGHWAHKDVRRAYSVGAFAWALPFTASPVPVVLTEFGESGGDLKAFDPDSPPSLTAVRTVEHTIALGIASGIQGFCHWAWGDTKYPAVKESLSAHAPLFGCDCEPLQVRSAEVVLVTRVRDSEVAGGIIQGLAGLAELLLDEHLTSVRLVRQEELKAVRSRGRSLQELFERAQVILVDADVEAELLPLNRPEDDPRLAWCDFAFPDAERIRNHMRSRGVHSEGKLPSGAVLHVDCQRAVVYSRLLSGTIAVRLPVTGSERVQVQDGRTGEVLYSGSPEDLAGQGMALELRRWRARILSWSTGVAPQLNRPQSPLN